MVRNCAKAVEETIAPGIEGGRTPVVVHFSTVVCTARVPYQDSSSLLVANIRPDDNYFNTIVTCRGENIIGTQINRRLP